MFFFRLSIMACPLKPPLTLFAATVAGKVTLCRGNWPRRTWEVGATWTTCGVPAEVYQDTTRCDSVAPTPRMMPVGLATGSAPATVVRPLPSSAVVVTAAAATPMAIRRRTGTGPGLRLSSFIVFHPVWWVKAWSRFRNANVWKVNGGDARRCVCQKMWR